MGGIIVVDFIDMQANENRQALFDRMKELMSDDMPDITYYP
ncbi:MAG: ribonuclease E/G [Bacteroidales bacterium]|nr:ribonuclease E/G [Bacteroidales bacterium]